MGLFSHKPPIANPDELQEYLAAAAMPVLVEFTERESPACQIQGPILADVSRRYADRLAVVKADVAASPETAARFGVSAVPTFVLFVKDEERLRLIGFQGLDELTEALEGALPAAAG